MVVGICFVVTFSTLTGVEAAVIFLAVATMSLFTKAVLETFVLRWIESLKTS